MNTLINEDAKTALETIADRSVDLIVTDPPYMVNYKDRTGRSVCNDDNDVWLPPIFSELYRVLGDNAFVISFYGSTQADKMLGAWKDAGFRPVGNFVCVKNYASGAGFTERRHEMAYLLAKGRPRKPIKPLPDVLQWGRYTGNKHHPTEKPLSLMKLFVKVFSRMGDVVLDPFAGSGTTLVAAKETGRQYIGVEIDPDFYHVARSRVARTRIEDLNQNPTIRRTSQ